MTSCPNCAASIETSAKFCMQCGTALSSKTPEQSTGERRQITVAFIDIAGFTKLASVLDPEDLEDMVGAYYAIATEVITEARGTIEEFLGDGIVAIFGFPIAAEDAASRAIKAASTVIERVAAEGLAGHSVALRAGVATGEVAVKPGHPAGQRLTGLVLAMAARLQNEAKPDAIVAAALTRQLAARNYIFTARAPIALKGIGDNVLIYDVQDPGSSLRTVGQSLFGRDAELATLSETTTPVVIWGEPGLGKSALAARFAASKPQTVVFQASSIASANSHAPIIEWLQGRIGSPAPSLDVLSDAFPQLGDATIGFLGLLLGAPESLKTYAELMPALIQGRIEEALITLFRSLAEDREILFIWEDLHWIDAASLALFEASSKALADTPARIIATSRPSGALRERLDAAHVGAITLNPLDIEAAQNLAAAVGGADMAGETVAEIAQRAEGVPLYLEQLSLAVASGETFEGVPPTLKDLLTSRLDRSAEAKPVAQLAAAIGRRFDIELLAALSPRSADELTEQLAALAAGGLVQSLADGGVQFTHVLLRDAAYDSMLLRERRTLHGRIGDVMMAGDVSPTPPDVVADHYERAGRHVESADLLRTAAQLAAARGAFADAEAHLRRAAAFLKPDAEKPEITQTYVSVLTQLGATLMQTQGFTGPDVIKAYDEADTLSQTIDGPASDAVQSMWGHFVYQVMVGDLKASRRAADNVLAIAKRGSNGERQAEIEIAAHVLQNCVNFYSGRFTEQFPSLDYIRANYDAATHAPMIPQYGMDFFGAAQMFELHARTYMGETHRTDALVAEADAHQAMLNIPLMRPYASIWGGVPYVFTGEIDRALERIEPGIELADSQGDVFWSLTGRIWQAIAECSRKPSEVWQAQLSNAIATSGMMGAGVGISLFQAHYAVATAALGQPEAAHEAMSSALANVEDGRDTWMAAEVHRLNASVARMSGNLDDCLTSLVKSTGVARGQGARLFEMRSLLDMAELLETEGPQFDTDPDARATKSRLDALRDSFPGPVPEREAARLLAVVG